MKRVAVIGAGQTTFGLFPEATLKQLMADAAIDAFKSVDKGLPPEDVDEVFVGSLSTRGSQLGNFAPLMVEAADGRATLGTELTIYDDTRTRILPPGEIGELATRGPHVALGYFNDPERTASTFSPDGWLFSNDLATIDSDGYIRIVGRKKDIINRGGLKIAAREIEELLLESGRGPSCAHSIAGRAAWRKGMRLSCHSRRRGCHVCRIGELPVRSRSRSTSCPSSW